VRCLLLLAIVFTSCAVLNHKSKTRVVVRHKTVIKRVEPNERRAIIKTLKTQHDGNEEESVSPRYEY